MPARPNAGQQPADMIHRKVRSIFSLHKLIRPNGSPKPCVEAISFPDSDRHHREASFGKHRDQPVNAGERWRQAPRNTCNAFRKQSNRAFDAICFAQQLTQ